jgi:hypothetical protein
MKEWKHEEGNWDKYWKSYWEKNWGEEGQKQGRKYQEMGKIMHEMGKTQYKVAKLIVTLANKKGEEEFKKETSDLEEIVKSLKKDIDKKYDKLK